MGQKLSSVGSFAKKLASPVTNYVYPQNSHSENSLTVSPFVFSRYGSMYFDEDGDLAHEFYEEVRLNGRYKMKRQIRGLTPEGEVFLDIPRLHVDFPAVMCEAPRFSS